jgi:FtsP/CotA-like multicopper oxidase with cupredoxin domain
VYRGLAGYFLVDDELEEALVADGRIPGPAQELPLLLQDRSFNGDGTLFYDFFDHDGFLGDVQVVNGRLQPRVAVERRRYRLRLLNGANARMFDLRLTSGDFLQIGADGWALPRAVRRRNVFLGMAERADVIVDFRGAPDEVFLANWCEQDDGRGPGGGRSAPDQLDRGVPLLRFDVRGAPVANDLARPLQAGEVVKPLAPPPPPQRTRSWVLERKNGVWVVNDRIFDPDRPFAVVPLGATERWTFENKSGGWWHPVHVHDEAMRVRTINGRAPPPWEAGKRDMVNLGPNDRLEAIIQFRDWPGRWVWHCHNVEHEDMRMMARFDVR